MPAPEAPLRSGRKLFTYRERFRLLRQMFSREISDGRVRLSVLEHRLPGPHYTIQTLEALKKYCVAAPTIVVGADQAEKLGQWKRSAELVQGWRFLVFARRDGVVPDVPEMQFDLVSDFAYDISSTAVREQLRAENDDRRYQMAAEIAARAPTSFHPMK